jgi:hypothetical protein
MKPADLRREFAGDRIVDAPSKSVRSARNFRIDQVDLGLLSFGAIVLDGRRYRHSYAPQRNSPVKIYVGVSG